MTINGTYSAHEFNQQDPADVLRALRDEAAEKQAAAKRRLEAAENSVIAAKIDLEHATEVHGRFVIAIAALPEQFKEGAL